MSKPMRKKLDIAFLLLEAVMHVYLVLYLISIKASILSIGFTVFELTMFVRLLKGIFNKENHGG